MAASIDHARAVKNELVERLAPVPGVVGIGLARADGGWSVKVNMLRGAPRPPLPNEISGVAITVVTVGRIVAD